MLIRVITYLATLSLGALASYFYFSFNQPQESSLRKMELDTMVEITQAADEIDITQIKVGDSINQETLDKLNQLIKSQQVKIKNLQKRQLSQETENQQPDEFEEESNSTLEAISMKDFQELLKEQFIKKFRRFSVELEAGEFESMSENFDRTTTRADWSDGYEENINNFIYKLDPDGIHYIDHVTCNNYMCRLKIRTDEGNKWQNLIYSMAQEDWFQSITLKEKSDDPTSFTYFLSKPGY